MPPPLLPGTGCSCSAIRRSCELRSEALMLDCSMACNQKDVVIVRHRLSKGLDVHNQNAQTPAILACKNTALARSYSTGDSEVALCNSRAAGTISWSSAEGTITWTRQRPMGAAAAPTILPLLLLLL